MKFTAEKARDYIAERIVVQPSGCWEWQRSRKPDGYGQGWDGERVRLMHQMAYETHVGPVPAGKVLDHLCKNPPCINPDHLDPVPQGENLRRAGVLEPRGLRSECPKHGSEFMVIQNRADNGRQRANCRECRNELQRARRAKSKQRP